MMKAKRWIGIIIAAVLLNGCGNHSASEDRQNTTQEDEIQTEGIGSDTAEAEDMTGRSQETHGRTQEAMEYIEVGTTVTELESGFSVVRFEGNDSFDAFLNQGGAQSDREVLQFLAGARCFEQRQQGQLWGV